MARDYGRICTVFWNSQDVRGLSDQGKLLASYLLTGPHSNSIGAYLLPDAYIADDLGWGAPIVAKAMRELISAKFVERFQDGRHIVVCKFLEFNPIENPNVGKGALRQLEQLPDDPALQHVLTGLQNYKQHFPNGFETVEERFRNMEPNLAEPLPEPDIDRPAAPPALPRASRFGDFWVVCPKKIGKGKAKALFDKACRENSPDLIIAAMQRYAASRAGEDPQFTKHPETWLSKRCWEDEGTGPPSATAEVISIRSAFESQEELEGQRRLMEKVYGQTKN